MPDQAYAQQGVLVSTQWVADNLHRTDKVRIVESNEDVLLYATGHIPNAAHIDWVADLNDAIRRDYLNEEQFAALMARAGISNDTTVVFYGDKNNWWATYAFWVFKLFGHEDCRIMNGGRQKWIAEGRELTKDKPSFPTTTYRPAARADYKIRAFRDRASERFYAEGSGKGIPTETLPTLRAMFAVLDHAPGFLPADRPRYLMGVGKPDDIVGAVERGEQGWLIIPEADDPDAARAEDVR